MSKCKSFKRVEFSPSTTRAKAFAHPKHQLYLFPCHFHANRVHSESNGALILKTVLSGQKFDKRVHFQTLLSNVGIVRRSSK